MADNEAPKLERSVVISFSVDEAVAKRIYEVSKYTKRNISRTMRWITACGLPIAEDKLANQAMLSKD